MKLLLNLLLLLTLAVPAIAQDEESQGEDEDGSAQALDEEDGSKGLKIGDATLKARPSIAGPGASGLGAAGLEPAVSGSVPRPSSGARDERARAFEGGLTRAFAPAYRAAL